MLELELEALWASYLEEVALATSHKARGRALVAYGRGLSALARRAGF